SSRYQLTHTRPSRRCTIGAGTGPRSRSRRVRPAVSEPRVVLDAGEAVVDIAEFLSNPFDEGTHVDAVALLAVAGDEVLAAHEVVDLPVGDVGVAGAGQQPPDLEFGQRQVDALAVVEGAVDVDPQFKLAARHYRACERRRPASAHR